MINNFGGLGTNLTHPASWLCAVSGEGRTWVKGLLGVVLLLQVGNAAAIGSFRPSAAELSLLPPYCIPRAERWGNDLSRPEVRRWHSVFGDDYNHMHHYCQGMLLLLRGDRHYLQPNVAHSEYESALNNLEYMESRASAGFVLLPELYVKKGKVLMRLERDHKAVMAFRKSIQLKKDYIPAYAALSDFYYDRGKPDRARQVLEEGLAVDPKATILKRRLEEFTPASDENQPTAGNNDAPTAAESSADVAGVVEDPGETAAEAADK